jgi:hypothetical protein
MSLTRFSEQLGTKNSMNFPDFRIYRYLNAPNWPMGIWPQRALIIDKKV